MITTRRHFLFRAAGSVLAAGPVVLKASAGYAAPDADIPIIDTHQHLWDLGRLRLGWLPPGGELTRSFLLKDYLEAARGLNIVKAIYMEVNVDPSDLVREAEQIIELCRLGEGPTVAAVIGGRPAAEDFPAYLGRFKNSPYVKGIRRILRDGAEIADPRLATGLRLLGESGMSFDLCVPPRFLAEGANLVDRCPETRFILDHCGNADPLAFRPAGSTLPRDPQHAADPWRRDMAALARRKNIVCKISGIVSRMPKGNWTAEDLAPVINHCLDVFGPDRVMFAGDWPVCTRAASLRQWVEALRDVVRTRPEPDRRKLFHDNAARVYGVG